MRIKLLLITLLMLCSSAFAADEEAAAPQIAYYELKPAIVSNVTGGAAYIRINVQYMTEQPDMLDKVKTHSSALRHHIFMLIAGQNGNTLKSREGKEELRKGILDVSKKTMKELTGKEILNDVYFTAYYVK